MNIKNEFNIVEWAILVEAIVSGYFDEKGEYAPHIGMLNQIRVFYNMCVEDTVADLDHDITDIADVEKLVSDKELMDAFASAHDYIPEDEYRLTFQSALDKVYSIIEYKTNSWAVLAAPIKASIDKITESVANIATEENITLLSNLSKQIQDGNITADAIVKAYGESGLIEKIAERQ